MSRIIAGPSDNEATRIFSTLSIDDARMFEYERRAALGELTINEGRALVAYARAFRTFASWVSTLDAVKHALPDFASKFEELTRLARILVGESPYRQVEDDGFETG